MNIISREAARTAGMLEYFTGKPCKHGHVSLRKVSNTNCVDCQKERYIQNKLKYQQRYQNNRDELIEQQKIYDINRKEEIREYQQKYRERTTKKRLQYHKDYYQNNKEKLLSQSHQHRNINIEYYEEYNKQYYEDNRENLKEKSRQYHEENRDRILDSKQDYYKENKDEFINRNAKRRATKLNATPLWYEHDQVKTMYEQSSQLTKLTGIPHNVDHIVPLQGKLVCGLHCLDNLQIITAEENNKKGNKFII